jgi:LacI family transcriptional regulator
VLAAPFRGNDGPGAAAEAGWLYRVTSAFERTAKPAGVDLTLIDQSPHSTDPCSIKQIAHDAIDAGVQAAVLVHPLGTKEKIACALALLQDHNVHPIIVSARTYSGLASQVYFDSGWGSYLATRYLITRGHRKIGYAGAPTGHEWLHERLAGYRQALAVGEIDLNDEYVWLQEEGERLVCSDDGIHAFQKWLALSEEIRPTAVVSANDMVALGFLDAARAAGVSVPGDVSVIGFDNDPEALLAGLTTIERPTEVLGEAIARTLLERLAAGPHASTVTLRLRPVLIERATAASILTQKDHLE